MKHIVIDARTLRTSTGRYVERLLHYLQQLDNDHRYTVLLKPQDLDSWQPSNPNFSKLASPYADFSFGEQLGLKSQIESLQPDLVHFAMVQQPVLYSGPAIATMHDLTTIRFDNPAKHPVVFKAKQQVYKWVNRRVARKSLAIITPSEFVRQDVASFCGINPDKITVTYESADDLPTPSEPIEGLSGIDGKPRRFIMYVGRPTPHKNLERLLYAYGNLQKRHHDLHLVLAGKMDANYRRIEAMTKPNANQQGIGNVFFTDFISDNQLRWLYEHCSAYIFPSLSEGFGLPGLEAMRHGAPVVSSNATCLPEVYGDAALYFDPLSVQDMAAQIDTMLSDDKLRRQYIKKGRKQAGKYSWQRMAEQTLAVYNKALED